MEGYFTGVSDLYYAIMQQEETASTPPVYGAPKLLAKSIEVTVTPKYKEGKLDASNNPVRKSKKIAGYDVKAGVDKIPYAKLKEILARIRDANGVQHVNGGPEAPLLALGLMFTMDDGTEEYWWIFKGRFAELEKSGKTDVPDSTNYQTPTISGEFWKRMDTGDVATVVDSADVSVPAGVFANWFTYVYDGGDPAAIDPDELPIGVVQAVAALPTVGIDNTTLYVLTAADGAKAAFTMWRRVSDAWAQYGA